MILRLLVVILVLLPSFLYSQNGVPIYGWQEFFSLRQTLDITQNKDVVFFATENGIVSINKDDREIQSLTKINALSNSDITKIDYDPINEQLIVIYAGGSFDLITVSSTFTVTDIEQNTSILNSKTASDVYISADRNMYLAMEFGLVQYDLAIREFGSTFFSELPVYDIIEFNSDLWIATDTGFAYVPKNVNFSDPTNWIAVKSPALIDGSGNFAIWQDELYYLVEGLLTKVSKSGTVTIDRYKETTFGYIFAQENFLYALQDCYRCGLGLKKIGPDLENVSINTEYLKEASKALLASDGTAWFVSTEPGYAYTAPGETCEILSVNRPVQNPAVHLLLHEEEKILSLGGVKDNYNNTFSTKGWEYYDGSNWYSFNQEATPFLKENDIRDVLKSVYDPTTDRFYFASYWKGVVEWDRENFVLYNQTNSSLSQSIYDERIRVSDLDIDEYGNLWCTTFFSENDIAVKKPDGTWISIDCPYGSDLIHVITEGGFIYFVLKEQGLVVYDPGTSLEAKNDDRWKKIGTAEDGIPSTTIYTLTKDLDENIWVGTNQGAAYIYCLEGLDCTAKRPIVEPKYLLFNEQVKAVAIDGANRKWFGTNNGLYLQEEYIDDEIYHFTVENSPLVDQQILDIKIDPNSGLVYAVTNSGTMAFRSDATEGGTRTNKNIYAFPNPVKPDYQGPIAIKGLSTDAYVKIMDQLGNLIYEGRATGGQFIWPGTDQDGNRIGSGTYYAFSYNTDAFVGRDGGKVPILIIR